MHGKERCQSSSRHIRLIAVLLLLPFSLLAQNEEDALRIGTLQPGGTARSAGMANAFGALGADPSAIGINPAGFGLYRTSELSLTPSLEVNDATSQYYGTSAGDVRTRFFFNNLALILNNPSDGGAWRSGTFGVVYDRQQTHHWRRQALGERVPSSVLQRFVQEANGTAPGDLVTRFPFTSSLAWDTYAMDPLDTLANTYVAGIPFGSDTRQSHTIESRGASSQTAFFYSGNYMDRLYLGMSVGIMGHRYNRTTTHTDTSLDEGLDLEDATWREELTTSGNGIDVKVGVIVRVVERLRLGASFHSPQWMRLTDGYVTTMVTNFRSPDATGATSYTATSPDGIFAYRVNTPWRAVLSAAYVAGANGLVSVDYEYADFSRMRIRSSDQLLDTYDFALENAAIRGSYRVVHQVRVGTEWRTGNWYYRLGWGFAPDAYRTEDPRHGQALKTYAGGIGYRTDHVAVDLGLNFLQRTSRYFQYDQALVDATVEDLQNYRAMVTVSFRP